MILPFIYIYISIYSVLYITIYNWGVSSGRFRRLHLEASVDRLGYSGRAGAGGSPTTDHFIGEEKENIPSGNLT